MILLDAATDESGGGRDGVAKEVRVSYGRLNLRLTRQLRIIGSVAEGSVRRTMWRHFFSTA